MKNAKRWTVAVAALCLGGYVANVGATAIRVDLTTRYAQPKIVLLNQDSQPLALNSVAMLFWSATQDFAGFNNADPEAPLGGDILLATLPTTGGGPPVEGHITNLAFANIEYTSADYGVSLPSGFVYVAAFNLAHTEYLESGVPVGTFYSLVPTEPFDVGNKPDPTFLPDDVGLVVTDDGPYTMEMQTIPEPGTIMLLGLAGLVLFLRRRLGR
jgi:hypothetical protein